jgi:protein involved in polysaccharide export with SLBB domain
MKEDPYLRPGDVITVNRADRKVVLQGSVERPEEYELLDNENLKELIEIYGNGLDLQADSSRIEVVRFADGTEKSGKRFYLSNTDIENNYPLENRDIVIVSSYEELKPVFFIEGAINISSNIEGTELETSARRPLRFEKGTNYAYFIRQNSDIFGPTSDLQNAYIIRKLEIIPIDLNKILYDSSYISDLIIEPNDTLRIPFKQYFVSVAGSVKNPGRYPYIPDRTYEYYIGLAGGFVKSENTGESVSIIDINGDKVKKNEFITPESTITAKTNSFTYYFGIYAPVFTTILTAISTTLSIIAVTAK